MPLLAERLNVNLGLRPTLYAAHDGSTHAAPDPHISLQWRHGAYDGTLSWALRHQFLLFAGVTDMGLPTEFWMGTCATRPPQWAQGVSLTAGVWLPGRWRIEADVHYKRVHRQQEYVGNMLDYLTGDFTPDALLRASSGYNYGGSLMLSHPVGPLTGWVAYTYTRATRRSAFIETADGKFPASHERPHEFNAVAAYAPNRHWQFSATAVVASGTPFTAPRHFYIIGSSVVSQYGEHNANRLPPYARLDVSATYRWHVDRRVQQAVNVSVYNATAHKNALYYTICVHNTNNNYHYEPTGFITSVLPSVSYCLHF